jgi:hypothetical protein
MALWIEEARYNPLCDVDDESSSEMLSEELYIYSNDEINLGTEGETASEESSSDMLSEELDIDYDDDINLEIEGKIASEELSNEMSESESESETSVVACWWVGRHYSG